jgi:hypothetical protein
LPETDTALKHEFTGIVFVGITIFLAFLRHSLVIFIILILCLQNSIASNPFIFFQGVEIFLNDCLFLGKLVSELLDELIICANLGIMLDSGLDKEFFQVLQLFLEVVILICQFLDF